MSVLCVNLSPLFRRKQSPSSGEIPEWILRPLFYTPGSGFYDFFYYTQKLEGKNVTSEGLLARKIRNENIFAFQTLIPEGQLTRRTDAVGLADIGVFVFAGKQ